MGYPGASFRPRHYPILSGECRSSHSHTSEHIKATFFGLPFVRNSLTNGWPRPKTEVRGNPPIDTDLTSESPDWQSDLLPLSLGRPAVEMFKGKEVDMYDVIICGAGPTGVFLAAYLSRAGDVKVVNCHAYLRSRSC